MCYTRNASLNIMPEKKSTKKVAAKKAAVKPVTEKTAVAKKAPAKKAAAKQATPSLDAVAKAAYLNYRRRMEQGLPGDHDSDWLEAEHSSAN